MEKLLKLPEYKILTQLLSGPNDAKKGVSGLEIQHLCWLGTQVPSETVVVEIGSHRGKSLCAIACGMRSTALENDIYAVDLWTTGVNVRPHYNTRETFDVFNQQIADMGFSNQVTPLIMSSEDAARRYERNLSKDEDTPGIGLLFIDGNHRYKSVKQDYELWSPFIVPGGWIAFHDYGQPFGNVQKVIEEIVIPSENWKDQELVHTIWSARRK